MPARTTLEERISQSYAGLSDKLQVAATYVAEHPIDVATRSLRAVAATSGVSPATFSRLARALGYDDYEAMREDGRAAVGRKMVPFSKRAQALRATGSGQEGLTFLHRQAAACIANIEYLDSHISNARLEAAVTALHQARTVLLVGSQGSAGFVDYFGYLAQWFRDGWLVASPGGVTLAGALARMDQRDAILVLSKAPYASRSLRVSKAAKEKGLITVVITDSHAAPVLEFADHPFVVPTESPQFFSSYTATLVLIETIVSLLLARSGSEAEEMIREAEHQIHRLGETWSP